MIGADLRAADHALLAESRLVVTADSARDFTRRLRASIEDEFTIIRVRGETPRLEPCGAEAESLRWPPFICLALHPRRVHQRLFKHTSDVSDRRGCSQQPELVPDAAVLEGDDTGIVGILESVRSGPRDGRDRSPSPGLTR